MRAAPALLAAGACLGWVPFAGRLLSPDEGGLLLVGSQWSPGTSLYGDYWVDRPPVLIAWFAAADALGGTIALRLLGALAVVLAVVLAAVLGRGTRRPLLAPTVAATLLASPMIGGSVVNAEVLGVPAVLLCAVALMRSRSAHTWAWTALAGATATLGVLTKQSILDGFVLAAALLLTGAWGRRSATAVAGFVLGAGACAGLVLAITAQRGTDLGDLWNAVVVFRGQAAAVIAAHGTSDTWTRLGGVLLALVATGAPILAVLFARTILRHDQRHPLRWAAFAVLAWELVPVLFGGSYWLHYLTSLVPGLVLLAAVAADRYDAARDRRPYAVALGLAAVSTLASVVFVAVHPIARREAPPIEYLQTHAAPGQGAVVAFGAANILAEADLTSPYPDLWSLPVRVHDPDLQEFILMLLTERPTWVVLSGTTLGTWGVDDSRATPVLLSFYDRVAQTGGFTIYRARP